MDYAMTVVPGLYYVPEYLSPVEQDQFNTIIVQQPWLTDLKRRVQHYGYRYNYTRRSLDPNMFLGPLPPWAAQLGERLQAEGWSTQPLNQLIVNEYEPGQGISSHIDCIPCFGDTILSISLGSSCVMLFTHSCTTVQVPAGLAPGSLVVMKNEARYHWKHSIPARKTDIYDGRKIQRGQRVSLTFRTVIQEPAEPLAAADTRFARAAELGRSVEFLRCSTSASVQQYICLNTSSGKDSRSARTR